MVLNTAPLDWESSALTTKPLLMVDQTLSNLWSNLTNADGFSQQENDEVEKELTAVLNDMLDEQDITDELV